MLKNYLTIAWRNLYKNKAFSIINILGLALGIASTLLIIFHVKEELDYDTGFTRATSLFRVTQEGLGEDTRHWAATSFSIGPAMQQELAGIQRVVRFHRPYPYQVFSYTPPKGIVKTFEEKGGFFADSTVVPVFDLVFTRGNREKALTETGSIVLTEEMAARYFGTEDPVGKILQDTDRKLPLKVTGIVKAFRFNTHLQFDYLLSMETIRQYQDQQSLERRTWNGFYTYVQLGEHQTHRQVEAGLPRFSANFFGEKGDDPQKVLSTVRLHLQPVTSIHLHSKLEKEMYANSDIGYVYIFSFAALFILLVAAVNFVNIFTAQAFNRMKEIGLRKVVGASKQQLIWQFFGESGMTVLLATVLGLLLFNNVIPLYNNLAEKHLRFTDLITFPNGVVLVLLMVFIALLSGSYPAWFVSNFNPVSSIKGKKDAGSSVHMVRKGLIVFQFVVSIFMIFSTVIIYRQTQLFQRKELGFDKEQLLAVTVYSELWSSFGTLADKIKQNPDIITYSIASTLPGDRFSNQSFTPLSSPAVEDLPGTRVMWSDEKFLPTLRVALKAGRNFIDQHPTWPDIRKKEFIVNEAAVTAFHLKDPLGQKFVLDVDTGDIVGVVKDFNFASLHSRVEPMVIQYNPFRSNYLLLRVRPDRVPQALQFMEASIKELLPAGIFSYTFIDEKLDRLYASEKRMSMVFRAFAAIALLISGLGLFGLSAYAIRLRTREVSIRKVLGASIPHVTLLLSRDFLLLVLIATIIAWPLAWWAMNQWLNGFAYRVDIGVWVFALSGALAVLVAILTVSFQAIRTALLNPANALKTE